MFRSFVPQYFFFLPFRGFIPIACAFDTSQYQLLAISGGEGHIVGQIFYSGLNYIYNDAVEKDEFISGLCLTV